LKSNITWPWPKNELLNQIKFIIGSGCDFTLIFATSIILNQIKRKAFQILSKNCRKRGRPINNKGKYLIPVSILKI